MKILLLGGTGAIGSHLALNLSMAGNEVYVTSRSRTGTFQGIRYIQGNAKNIQFLTETLSTKWDAIVDFMNYTIDELSIRVDILLAHTQCYYFLSSSRVYADTICEPINEESPLLLHTSKDEIYISSNEYGIAKAKEEEILKSTGRTNWTIFRPYIIYSENRFQLGALEKEDWLYRVLQGKSIVLQSSLKDKYTTLTYSLDATEVMSKIIFEKKTASKVYNIAGGKTCCATWGEIANIYKTILQELLQRDIDVYYITDKQAHQLRKGSTYYQTSYDRMYYRVFDNSKTEDYKAAATYTSIYDGLEKSLSDFIKRPQFSFTNHAQEALMDSFTGEYSNVIKIPSLKNKLLYLYYRFFKTY